VSASRGMADVNLRFNADSICVATGQRLGKCSSLALLHQVDGATAKTSASEPRANYPGNCRANSSMASASAQLPSKSRL